MSRENIQVTDELNTYIRSVSLREPEIMRELREETGKMEHAGMQISPEQGQFMALLVRILGARRTLEVGTFTGYSALSVARALPEDGQVVACDVNAEWTAMAEKYWKRAGVGGKIDLRLGPAAETLADLVNTGGSGSFDFAFIDADKTGYDEYYERGLELLRPGGLMLLDNVLRRGRVLQEDPDEATAAIIELNRKIHGDTRVEMSMIPMSDGVTLVRKRETNTSPETF